jgi:hypothetical protein
MRKKNLLRFKFVNSEEEQTELLLKSSKQRQEMLL